MTTLSPSSDIFSASEIHLSVLDEFIGVVQRKLDETTNTFAQESLKDLLGSLAEQRESYIVMAEPDVVAA
jgi:hypothetical protein